MELLSNLALGFATAATVYNLTYCFVGVFLGTFIGVLPGVGPLAAVAMLLPVSFYLPPETALVMLAGVYYGAEYGGSIASILLNIPGTPSASVTCLDGYPMARDGRAGVALFSTAIASFFGAIFGVVVMVLLSPALAEFALLFGPAEYFAVMVLGLVAASVVSTSGALRGVMMVCLGILLGTVGVDINSGETRFVVGMPELRDGVSLVVVAMGLFGISEVMVSARGATRSYATERISMSKFLPTRSEWLRSIGPAIRGSAIGSFFGTLPGTGQTVASFVGYALEKRISPRGDKFGTGQIEGVVVPEAANNAAAQTAFIPTLTLGIPGSTTMALMLGALMIHGITPGPRLISEHPELFWGLIVSFLFGNLFLLILNIPLIGLWVRLLRVPHYYLYPTVVVLICVGVYSIDNSIFDIWMTLAFGVLGYVLRLFRFEPAPLLIGFVLGPMLEEFFRRAMLLSRGDPMVFLERPGSAALLGIALVLLLATAIPRRFLPWARPA
ncbi:MULTISPECIES: tripartite tricarboxylate transporter permease [Marivita]|uniref:Tripartite tricarboxylate transporter permease n=1 Tax=Marivita cryptomonadis TaxID=505252 RepID=A0A9Q2S133_9RHOB|nr:MULTISPECIES: tripartite tricarboxylate transporter permease [Marivita]MCR9168711.1 tripartite tricarboxylate transporter permease [Paracoccaceae bacterium]MBM2321000.1 tripartite tricarboxylate transporter permease [Marivita cryptomonadis]MBM2330581.1 tripartite tricarboxylate transporter permease [Marivita cryptomonadis]MBM2340167.1 tripartite tricarboxylate transporter permease [Marivita cryptomonadis]MBM2344829.1 tripartite tricarboxylate transporter permease [Marivita cryptomonadis]